MARLLLKWLPLCVSQQMTKLYFRAITRNQTEPHSEAMTVELSSMSVRILPALQDNYMYLLIDKATREAAVVDPVEPQFVMQAVHQGGCKLTTVLTTHHHWDHSGGNASLKQMCPQLNFYGGDDRIAGLTHKCKHNDVIHLGDLRIRCLYTPCHTTGHICFYVTSNGSPGDKIVFTGDTLFLGGCGRFFEGTAENMHNSLNQVLASLPDDTMVFCGHEYTLQNLKFGLFVEPNNEKIKNKFIWSKEARSNNMPTVPGTIGEEKLINPFMRVDRPTVQSHANCSDPISTMQVIRSEKDNFSG